MSTHAIVEVSRADVVALLLASPPVMLLLDVRDKNETDKGIIPGAKCIPLPELKTALALKPEVFRGKYSFPNPIVSAPIVVHCNSGGRAVKAYNILRDVGGHTDVRLYRGGWKEYSKL